MRLLLIVFILMLFASCNKRKAFDGPNTYSDDFEAYSNINELIDGNDELWSFFQITNGDNALSIDTTIVHSGNKSLRFFAVSNDDVVSKCSVNKQFMAFWEGETVMIDFWIYLEGNEDIDWLFIFDLEEKVPVGAGPGMRLAVVDNKILLEHKYPNPNVEQEGSGIELPRNQWVHIEFESKLERKEKGYVRVFQDGAQILSADNWQTLPKDLLYANQGTKGMYNQIEFGLTANADDNSHVLYLDDVNVVTVE